MSSLFSVQCGFRPPDGHTLPKRMSSRFCLARIQRSVVCELRTRTLRVPALRNTTKFNEQHPETDEKSESGCGRGKKARIFGHPTLRGPTFRSLTFGTQKFWSKLARPKPRWPKIDWPKLDWQTAETHAAESEKEVADS